MAGAESGKASGAAINMRLDKSRIVRSAAIALFALASGTATAQGAPQGTAQSALQSALLIGDVVNRETGTPLAHSMVTVLPAER